MTAATPERRILITGAAGFVGPHLVSAIKRLCGDGVSLLPTSAQGDVHPVLRINGAAGHY